VVINKTTIQQTVAAAFQKFRWTGPALHLVMRLVQPTLSIGVVGVVVNSQGQILIVKHVFHPRKPWGLPGGWIGRNESPNHTVQRELKEELELAVEVDTLLMAEVTFRNHLDIAYLCRPLGSIGKLSIELLDYGWFDPGALPPLNLFNYQAIERALSITKTVS
jgi:8-oxo-dGTP pyrophosphatase MutT (NUDIX family)